ncbi:M16 family metallopeptidase [Vulgatibacter incomptus]|uniref:Peptidase, M16 family n=1 Tax=Vulgatibacter incomptus TaxID=1391653 RepID=A0A0K1PFM0_9BACT|nr:pitrilysin family protein [Vulgatibacter incomptus]AKU91914.1 Peptidase, M16 family [Vulgatibacter incomptus]
MSLPPLLHTKDTLPNGLRVVTVETPHLHSAILSVYVRSGSRHESSELMGISHFLEHMFFRGSERYRDTVEMNARVEEAGGNLNGITTRDHGYYYTPLHPGQLEVGFEVIGDMLATPRLVQIETERQIILEEMLDEVDETGRDIDIDNLSKAMLFAGNGLAHKIAGTPKTVKRIGLEDLREHHRRMYVGPNLVLACAGPISRSQVLELAERHFGRLPAAGEPPAEALPLPPPPGPTVNLLDHEDSQQTEMRLNFLAPPEHDPDFPALLLARRILDDGLSSRLPFEVVEKRGLAYALHAGIDTYSDLSLFEVEVACAHQKVPTVLATIGDVLGGFASDGPTAAELDRAKRRYRMGLEFALDSASDLAGWFGGTELWRPAETFEERVARVEAVTADDLRRVCTKIFSRSNLHMMLVGRGGGRAEQKLKRQASELPLPK